MKTTGNTILITGGGSGIGLGLAEEFARLDNKVIIAGRSREKLTAAADKGFKTYAVDMASNESIQELTRGVLRDFPALNVVIHNAGVMKNENLMAGGNFVTQQETIATNLLGPMRLTDALLPHFLKQKSAVIMTVTSGLAFAPLAMTPTYSATKAAIHSYTQSLRYQLRDTSVQVIELAPPYVQTHLMGDRQANDPNAMPLKDFISEVLLLIKNNPDANEILVKRVYPQRFSSDGGPEKYESFFQQMNDTITAARRNEL